MQRDDSESRASLDVLPGMSFTPDSKFLIASWDGRLWKQPVDGSAAQKEYPNPYTVRMNRGLEALSPRALRSSFTRPAMPVSST